MKTQSITKTCALVSVLASTLIAAYCSLRHAPTFDETGHMVAGLCHWRFSRFELYRVNPPLARLVQTAPVACTIRDYDWAAYDPSSPTRQEFAVGHQLIHAHPNATQTMFFAARLAGLSFFVLGGWMCYLLARRLYGESAGHAVCCCWCWSPTLLGNAALMTPDVAAAAMGLVAIYWFLEWCECPHWSTTLWTGLAISGAMAAKATWILWAPIVVLAAVGLAIRETYIQHRKLWPTLARWLAKSIAIGAVCFVVLNTLYAFNGFMRPLGTFQFRSESLAGLNHTELNIGNRFLETWMAGVPSPLPADYVLGIDRQKMEFEWNKPAYLRGTLRDGGWWYYYLYAAAVKMPLAFLMLLGCAALSLVAEPRLGLRELVLLGIAVALFTMVSSQTGINKHFRYVLPSLPLFFVFAGRLWKLAPPRLAAGCWVLILLGAIESLWAVPHSLSFFNMAVGGPQQGRFHLLNSNVSWGQDVARLVRWQRQDRERSDLFYAALHTNYDPTDLGLDFSIPPELNASATVSAPGPGLYAIEANVLMGYPYPISLPGRSGHYEFDTAYWRQFQNLEPVAQIGYSIFIYHVDADSTK